MPDSLTVQMFLLIELIAKYFLSTEPLKISVLSSSSAEQEAVAVIGYAEFDYKMFWGINAEKVRSGDKFVFDGHLVAKRTNQSELRQVSSVSSSVEPRIAVRIALERKWNPDPQAVMDRPHSGTTPARPPRSEPELRVITKMSSH